MRFFIAYMLAIGFYLGTATVHAQTTQPSIVSVGIQYSDATKIVTMHPAVLEAVRVAMEKAFPATQPSTKPATQPVVITGGGKLDPATGTFKVADTDAKGITIQGAAIDKLLRTNARDVWPNPRHAGPTGAADDGSPLREGQIRCVSGFNHFENLYLTGNDGGILLGSDRKGMPDILCRNIYSDSGVALGRFQGGHSLTIINYGSSKPSWAYPISLFTDEWDEVTIDNSGIPLASKYFWLRQGFRILNGKENGEAIYREMWGLKVRIVGLNLLGVEYTGQRKDSWKQVAQFRSTGHPGNKGQIVVINSQFAGLVQIGFMAGGPDAGKTDHWLNYIRFEGSVFTHEPQITNGVGQVEYVNCFTGTFDSKTFTWSKLKPLNKTVKGKP